MSVRLVQSLTKLQWIAYRSRETMASKPAAENSEGDNSTAAAQKVVPDSTPKLSFFSFFSLVTTSVVRLLIPQLLFLALICVTPFFLIFEFFKLIAAIHALLTSLLTSREDARKNLLFEKWINKRMSTLVIFRDGITSFYSAWGSQVALLLSTLVITFYTSSTKLFYITAATSVSSFALQWLNSEMDPSQEIFCFFIAKTKLSYLNMYYSYLDLKIRGSNPITAESFNTANFCFDQKTATSFNTSGEEAKPLHLIVRGKYTKERNSAPKNADKKMAKRYEDELAQGIQNRFFMTYGNWHILLKPFLRQEFVCRLIRVSQHDYKVRCYRNVVTLFDIAIGGFHKVTFDQNYSCEGDWFEEFGNLLGLIVEENFTICRKFEIEGLSRSYTFREIIDCFMQSKKGKDIVTEKQEPLTLEEGHAEEGHAKDLEGEPIEPLQKFYTYKLTESPIWF